MNQENIIFIDAEPIHAQNNTTVTVNIWLLSIVVLAIIGSNVLLFNFMGGNFSSSLSREQAMLSSRLYLLGQASVFVEDVSSFEYKVREVSDRLNIPPEWLMSVMYSESKFDAGVANYKGSGATGLIQWMPNTAKDFGITTAELKTMTHVEQLEYVYKYLDRMRRSYGEYNSLTELYLAILYPVAIKQDYCYALYEHPSRAYKQNSGLDENKDKQVTKSDIDKRMKRVFPTAYIKVKK